MRLSNIHILTLGLILFVSGTIVLHGNTVLFAAVVLVGMSLLFFFSLRMAIGNAIGALFATVLLFAGISFLEGNSQFFVTLFIGLVCLIWCGTKYAVLTDLVWNDWTRWGALERKECLTWVFLVLLILPLGISDQQGFWSYEFHPIYELSVGSSYALSIFHAPDLSYFGKGLRIHFLSTQIPHYLSNLFQVQILTSAYFLIPLWCCFLAFILIQVFFVKFPTFKVPALYLFFTPLLGSGILEYQGVITSTLLAPLSYFLGFILIGVGTYYLITENVRGLVLASMALILTKASFFLVLLGGIVLYFGRTFDFKKVLKFLAIILPIFMGLYAVFLSGAHSHNHWLIFPTIPYFALFEYGLSLSGVLFVFFPTIVLIFTVLFYLNNNGDRVLLGLASCSLSGMLGALILTEASESNSLQFLVAAFFPMILLVWHGVSAWAAKKQTYRSFGHVLFLVFVILGVFSSVRAPFESLVNHFSNHKSAQGPSLSDDLIQAYTWMKQNTPQNRTILFGKHYESKKSGSMWWPDTGFARSALSGKQMYCENFKYKGIAMEEDFPLRFANTVHFYRNFVTGGLTSDTQLMGFYTPEFGKEPGNPFSQPPRWTVNTYTKLRRQAFYYLSFGKEWSWVNRPEQVYYEMRQHLAALDASEDWLVAFLRTEGVGYVVLEHGDQPSNSLKKFARAVYRNDSIIILEVKQEHLVLQDLMLRSHFRLKNLS